MLLERQATLKADREFYEVENRVVWPDGQVRWVYGRGRVRRDQEGHPLAVIAIYLDDTERKRATEGPRVSEARLRAVFDTIQVGIVLAEAPSGLIIGGNAYAEKIFGHPLRFSQDAKHYDEWISFHPNGRRVASHEYPHSRVIRGEAERPETEAFYQCGDRRRSWIRLIAAPI